MRFGAMEHMVPGDTFAERARHLRDVGCEAVELTVGDGGPLLGSLRARVPEIVQVCRELGLRAAVVTTRIADLLDQDPARRAAAMAALRDNLEVAAAVGAIGALLVPRFGSPSLPDLSPYAPPISSSIVSSWPSCGSWPGMPSGSGSRSSSSRSVGRRACS